MSMNGYRGVKCKRGATNGGSRCWGLSAAGERFGELSPAKHSNGSASKSDSRASWSAQELNRPGCQEIRTLLHLLQDHRQATSLGSTSPSPPEVGLSY